MILHQPSEKTSTDFAATGKSGGKHPATLLQLTEIFLHQTAEKSTYTSAAIHVATSSQKFEKYED